MKNVVEAVPRPAVIIISVIVVFILLCGISFLMYKTSITDDQTAKLEEMMNNWEICGDSSKDYTDLTLKRGQMLPQHHIVVVGEDVDRDGKRYYVIDNTPSIGLDDAGEVVAYGYEKVKPDRFNCNTVFVSEENGEERIETVAGAYDDTGKKNEFADFPWILTRYIELTQPSIDLEQYYEDDKRKMLKLIN